MPDPSTERPALTELVDRALAQDSRRFQRLLAKLYVDPQAAQEAFRVRAAEAGAQTAGQELAAEPKSFGAMRAGIELDARVPLARETGYVGGLAHLLHIHRENPQIVAEVLTDRFHRSAGAVFVDVPQMHRTWAEAVQADGLEAAAARLTSDPQSFGALRPGGERFARELAVRGTDAAHARAHAATHAREHESMQVEARLRLPGSVADLENRPGGRLPRPLELKLEAFTADFRGKLAAAYVDPERAEAAFHEISTREGMQVTVQGVRRSPQVLGPLRNDDTAAVLAYAAARRGARAYEINSVRNPAQAADLLLRETQRSLARQVANPAEALDRIQAAIRARGVERVSEEIQREPRQFFAPLGEQTLNPASLAADVRALGEADRVADHYVSEATERRSAPRTVRDLPVHGPAADALQAHVDATTLLSRKGDLHVVLNEAANALTRVESAVKWYGIREAQLRTALRQLYANPVNAEAELIRLADEKGADAAIECLVKKPKRLGALASGRSGDAARVAEIHARAFFDARDKRENVHYTDRNGQIHRGVESVRGATTAEIGSSSAELNQTETQLRDLSGVEGTRARAIHAVEGLSPEQADRLVTALQSRNPHAAQPLQAVRETAAARREIGAPGRPVLPPGAHHTVIQGLQIVRSMSEGHSP